MKFSLKSKAKADRNPGLLPKPKPLTRGLSNHLFDVIVIGAGPAGLAAGTQSAMAGLDTIIIESNYPGGGMSLLDCIDDFPGVEEGISGADLTSRMYEMAMASSARIELATVLETGSEGEYKTVEMEKDRLIGRTLIIATGTRPKNIGLLNEEKFLGSGMSYNGYLDAELASDRDVAVIGIGDHAAKTAIFLSKAASLVYLVTGGPRLRVTKKTRDGLLKKHTIEILREHRAVELLGEGSVQALRLRSIEDETKTSELPVAAVYGCGGTMPNTECLCESVALNEEGFVEVDDKYACSTSGIMAAGSVASRYCPSVANAVSDGLLAARHAEEYVYRQMRSS
jgi:thioredoxin reductase (NADPH)